MNRIHRQALRHYGQHSGPCDFGERCENGTAIQNRAYKNKHREETEHRKGQCFQFRSALMEKEACNKACNTIGQHLPGSSRALREEKIAGEKADCAG